jgi:hypothetical protein
MNRNLIEKIINGVKSPSKIPGFFRRKKGEFGIRLRNRKTMSQKGQLQKLLSQDDFLLIIFDSCRLDSFKKMYSEYYSGDLQKVYTTNTFTKQYLRSYWSGNHDVTYVAGGPVISDQNFELADLSYRPSEHFSEVIPAWDMGYKKELGVTPPEAVTEVALDTTASRMIVHYFQPHAPYIGNERLRKNQYDSDGTSISNIETRAESILDIYDEIKSGAVDDCSLRAVYESNLERVMEAAKPLISRSSQRTVITSDHGELLGEDGRYLHGGEPHPILCELPWFEVTDIVGDVTNINQKIEKGKKIDQKESVKQQLRDLGYAAP